MNHPSTCPPSLASWMCRSGTSTGHNLNARLGLCLRVRTHAGAPWPIWLACFLQPNAKIVGNWPSLAAIPIHMAFSTCLGEQTGTRMHCATDCAYVTDYLVDGDAVGVLDET